MVRETELVTGNIVLKIDNDKSRNMKNGFCHQADLYVFLYSV